MKTLTFIGDVHGHIEEYASLLGEGPTFQLGDMGAGFVPLSHGQDAKHRFIRGNHDDPAVCQAHLNYAGEFGYDPEYHLFFMGGAWSIDYAWRLAQMAQGGPAIFWKDEELSPERLEEAFNLYVEIKPDIVATHECPAQITKPLLKALALNTGSYFDAKMPCGQSRTSRALQRMFEAHKPKVWFFGHYHINRVLEVEGTKFVCLAELSQGEILMANPEEAAELASHTSGAPQDQ